MAWPKLYRRSYRIAVLGGYQTGKTVFTTSLINHIKRHKPSLLRLGKPDSAGGSPVKITFDKELPRGGDLPRFEYEQFRNARQKTWPKKTKATAAYHCRFYRTDFHWTVSDLFLLDVPGERYADLPMAKKSFSEWSEWLLEQVFAAEENRQQCAPYLELFHDKCAVNSDKILTAYKKILTQLYQSFRPFITPSTFLLAENGVFHGRSIFRDSDFSTACTGLGEDSQFAPLPLSVKAASPDVYKQFERAFVLYQKKLVAPLHRALTSLNQLIVLVDITNLLAANTGTMNGYRLLLEEIVDVLSPGCSLPGSIFNTVVSYLTGGRVDCSGINRIAVVATKADKVLKDQRDNLDLLLKEMTEQIFARQQHKTSNLEVEYFWVSAIKSVHRDDAPNGRLRGIVEGEEKETEYVPSSVPKAWPPSWNEGEFIFPDVEPRFPESILLPPEHIGLDDLMTWLFDFPSKDS